MSLRVDYLYSWQKSGIKVEYDGARYLHRFVSNSRKYGLAYFQWNVAELMLMFVYSIACRAPINPLGFPEVPQ